MNRSKLLLTFGICATQFSIFNITNAATTCESGIATALPTPQKITIDGALDDWDLSGEEAMWIADVLADQQYCKVAFMYDDEALYIAVRMGLHDHELTNTNRPEDRYWQGDLVQLRLSTDRSLPYPLPIPFEHRTRKPFPCYAQNDKVTCINIWRNTASGQDCLYVTPGACFDCKPSLHPAGSALVILPGAHSFTAEARVPWSALGCPDGKCPYKPGEMMPALLDIKWAPGTDGHFVAGLYRQDPGAFGFQNLHTWGRIRFAAAGKLAPHAPTLETIANKARAAAAAAAQAGTTPITFSIPKTAYVSVNIIDEHGGIIKELMGGEKHEKGTVTAYWDGRDQYGNPCATGREYQWRAYLNDGVDVEYFGTVGTEGVPPYETPDGKGGWGGDHGPCAAAAADATGRYFIWHMNESGKAIVKTDFAGKVLWRSAPFVCGGWGAYTCATVCGNRLYVVFDDAKEQHLIQVNTATGDYELWSDGRQSILLGKVPEGVTSPLQGFYDRAPTLLGCASNGQHLFLTNPQANTIEEYDPVLGKHIKTLCKLEGARGLAYHAGTLYAATAKGIYSIVPETGAMQLVVTKDLADPYFIAFDAQGRMYVSDHGAAQQVKCFALKPEPKLLKTIGCEGGRPLLGAYNPNGLRCPAALACDQTGTLIIPELASPKVFLLVDTRSFTVTRRYFGYTAYSPSNIPDCDDPFTQYYSLAGPNSFARATVPATGGIGSPTACWDFVNAGRAEFGCVFTTMTMGEVLRCTNGHKYLVPDGDGGSGYNAARSPRTICLIEGDTMRPVAGLYVNKDKSLEVWSDLNGNEQMEAEEKQTISQLNDEKFVWSVKNGSIYMDKAGNLYVVTLQNKVLEFPCEGFTEKGAPRYDLKKARVAIPQIVPNANKLFCTWREGLVGLRKDDEGNFYGVVAWSPDYVTDALTKKMHTGLGHTSRFTATKFFKYAPDGSIIWQAGRKGTSAPKQGEILHFWCIAGLIGNDYTVCASEWGPFWIYTHDGFYAGQLFATPGMPGRGNPYKFGGEDFSGAIRYFPVRNEVWAYNAGHTFRVSGFDGGKIKGEMRFGGSIKLAQVKPLDDELTRIEPLTAGREVKFRENLGSVKVTRLTDALCVEFNVKDSTPLVNVARSADQIFKGGDAVGIELAPRMKDLPRELPERKRGKEWPGFVRIVAAQVDGKPMIVGMKPFTRGPQQKQEYSTPAGGNTQYDWFGIVPGARVTFAKTATGYSARMVIPKDFFEFDISQTCAAEAEILFSGEGGRGLGTVRRLYLYSPDSSQTTMVDDTPTEARMYPQGWSTFE